MRRDRLYLEDIRDACLKVARFIEDQTFESFSANEILFDATVRNLQNIGEAVRALSPETRAQSPEIEWSRMVGLRHILVHQYFGVDEEIVWDLASVGCPELLLKVEAMLAQQVDPERD